MHINRTTKGLSGKTGYSRHDSSVLCMFAERRKKKKDRGKPLRVVIPYGTETNIHCCSSGESYSSLKRKAAGSKQLLGSTPSSCLFQAAATVQSPRTNASVVSKQLLSHSDPGECVAATAVAAALLVLHAGGEPAVALGAWELGCPGAVAACKL